MSLPPALKALAPYINHANQVEALKPLTAFFFRKYVIEYIWDHKLQNDPEVRKFLPNFLDLVDPAKNGLKVDFQKDINDFLVLSNSIFGQLQSEYEKGIITDTTKMRFSECLLYYKVYDSLQKGNAQVENKIKYIGSLIVKLRNQQQPGDDELLASIGISGNGGYGYPPTQPKQQQFSTSNLPPPQGKELSPKQIEFKLQQKSTISKALKMAESSVDYDDWQSALRYVQEATGSIQALIGAQ
ncbi:MAG: hypothetical protein EZS28_033182 [Streblomastix strix]|uniref:Vta1/callose synthase N-terminal domain-containing protein n=1 Tax=Streblomastix strix TaxID=222440 RepID=A0A5J4UMP7_9EUKA|nr:MAG: hypothetical protein EZS28_033182 [Streblomastix strix]